MRVREDKIREALKRILPFKPTAHRNACSAEIASDLELPYPMHRLLEGDVGSGKTIVAFEAATIAIENGYQVALMAPTEILAAQHYLSARRIFHRGEPAQGHAGTRSNCSLAARSGSRGTTLLRAWKAAQLISSSVRTR